MANKGTSRTKKRVSREEIDEAVSDINRSFNKNVLAGIKVELKCKTVNQKKLVNEIKQKEIVICSGLPGTGKTYIACAVAMELLKTDPRYKKIVLVKSVTTLRDEEIGFLKGTLEEKMEPFMRSFVGNFEKIIGEQNVANLKANRMIREFPIAYLRGETIDNAIILIDEAQNISRNNMRTIMTRIGENSKMIFLGDTGQIDLKKKSDSSLQFIINMFESMPEIGTVVLGEDDIVRNPLIKKIEKIFRENT